MKPPVADSPAISITISTVQGWPHILRAVRAAEAAAAAVGGEVIVTDGSGAPPPGADELAAATTWRVEPGTSVFQLRRLAYAMTAGPIVAITEDHCRVPPDWARRIIDAHAAHPEAAAIGGSVENGATGSRLDWASFLVVQITLASPIVSGPATRLAGAVNTAYKRDALDEIDDFDGLGALDVLHILSLRRSGRTLVADDSIRVVHDQSLGLRATTMIHFHAGRTFTGFLRRRMDRTGWIRLIGAPFVPFARFARIVIVGRTKGLGPQVRATWPAVLYLLLVQAVGHAVGFAFGPGDSPNRVQ